MSDYFLKSGGHIVERIPCSSTKGWWLIWQERPHQESTFKIISFDFLTTNSLISCLSSCKPSCVLTRNPHEYGKKTWPSFLALNDYGEWFLILPFYQLPYTSSTPFMWMSCHSGHAGTVERKIPPTIYWFDLRICDQTFEPFGKNWKLGINLNQLNWLF